MRLAPAWLLVTLWVLFASVAASIAAGQEPLHARIDQLIAARFEGRTPSPPASDSEFLRRIYLDLAGRIPSSDEARQFLDDPSPDKRARLVDRLLEGPDYPRRMAELFHVVLMERQGDHAEWSSYLQTSFAANKPWDVLVREILNPDPASEATRGAGFFYSKRLEKYGQNPTDYPGLTRDVGRLFLGMDLQCAQCHDHLFIDDYKQVDFQGLYAIFTNTYLRSDAKFPAVGEKVMSAKVEFASVFDKVPMQTGPRVPGQGEIEIPTFPKGEEYLEPPDPKAGKLGVLKFSPLKELSARLPTPENASFAENFANRMWFLMMGRGLVHPLDLHHADNPPSHPELLELLAQQSVEHKFDIKWLLRELALSQTYQRSSVLAEGAETAPPERYLVALEKRVSAEQLLWSMLQALGEMPAAEGGKLPETVAGGMKLEELRQQFVKTFANQPKEPEEEFAPSVKGALFVLNDKNVLTLLEARPGNLIDRLAKEEDPGRLAEELYLAVFSRRPDDEEKALVAEYLEKNAGRKPTAIGHLVWAMMASTEFCVNH